MTKVSKVSQLSSPLDDNLLSLSVDVHGNVCEFYASGRRRVSIDFSNDPGLTEQSHKDSCDITYILSQHVRMGGIPPMPEQAFQDFTNVPDYQTALNTVLQIDSLFESLPLEARVAYDHDPARFMAAVYDSKSATYTQITVMRRREEAIRAFAIACQNPQSDFFKYAEDYSLFEIASFCDDVGLPEPNIVPQLVMTAVHARAFLNDSYSPPPLVNQRLPGDPNNDSVN